MTSLRRCYRTLLRFKVKYKTSSLSRVSTEVNGTVDMHRKITTLRRNIEGYLDRNSLIAEDPAWEIKKSPIGGVGLFARRAIQVGEEIFKDTPIILGPRNSLNCPLVCVSCYSKKHLVFCDLKCGLPLCSENCQKSLTHQKECKILKQWHTSDISPDLSSELFKVLTPLRSLLLSDEDKDVVKCLKAHRNREHGWEIDVMKNNFHFDVTKHDEEFMRFVCSVMDSNSFEVLVGDEEQQASVKGLFPVSSLANHSCTPNTMHVFDDQKRMLVRAALFIPKGEEIFHSYSRVVWCTLTRRYQLYRTKHFFCRCTRCLDPTEFGTYMSALLCKSCQTGRVTPICLLRPNSKWECDRCANETDGKEVTSVFSFLGSILNSFDREDSVKLLKFIEQKLPSIVPKHHEAVIASKDKIIWIFGHKEGFTWSELSDEYLLKKEIFCKDILDLLQALHLGQCKMRGLILFELYLCYCERKRRDLVSEQVNGIDMNKLLLEAATILKHDVGAPKEVKELWKNQT